MQNKLVTIFGGSGFLGTYIVKELAKSGFRVKIVSRHVGSFDQVSRTAGAVGQVIAVDGNIRSEESLRNAIRGSDIVINCVGVLFEEGKQSFEQIHHVAAGKIAKIAKESGASRLIHISAILDENNVKAKYSKSKLAGEKAAMNAFPNATIVRPSVIFGAEDNFFNQFAAMCAVSPALPAIGGGATKLQPVYVDDIAKAVIKIIEDRETRAKLFELGGPEVLTFKQILEYILKTINKKRCIMSLPYFMGKIMGFFMEFLPTPPLTRDQVELLKQDNVLGMNKSKVLHFADLGISPKSIDSIVPKYLERYKN